MTTVLLWLAVLALFGVGLAGIVIPAVPGLSLIFAGIVLYAAATGFTTISGPAILVFGVVALLGSLADIAASGLGSRWGGGGKRAVWGTILGGIIGMLSGAGVPGLLVGAFVGAFTGAALEGKSHAQAGRIAVVSVVALLGGRVVQLGLGLVMIAAFFITLVT